MKNRVRSLLVIILIIFLFLFLWISQFDCLFKTYLDIPCPGCGMTRAFEKIFDFDIIGSFKYNILAFPSFVAMVFIIMGLFYDFITDGSRFWNFGFKFLEKYYIIIIIVVLTSYGINMYRDI